MTQAVPSAPAGEGADEFRLDGYVALVTGAGRGIGAGIAQTYARAGADLVLVARTATDLGHVAASALALGRTALVIPADLTDVSQAEKIVERTIAECGRLDILVNNMPGMVPPLSPHHCPARRPGNGVATSPDRRSVYGAPSAHSGHRSAGHTRLGTVLAG